MACNSAVRDCSLLQVALKDATERVEEIRDDWPTLTRESAAVFEVVVMDEFAGCCCGDGCCCW